jgi:hypothetical protein
VNATPRGSGDYCGHLAYSAPCASGLVCNFQIPACAAPKPLGAACSRGECAADATCVAGVCSNRQGVGLPCEDIHDCVDGLVCTGSLCANGAGLGADCRFDTDCTSAACSGGRCVPHLYPMPWEPTAGAGAWCRPA